MTLLSNQSYMNNGMVILYRGLQMERVAAVNTSAGAEGWLELNVTMALRAWLTEPTENRGFFITIHPHSQPGKC